MDILGAKMRKVIKPALFLLALVSLVVLAYQFGASMEKQK